MCPVLCTFARENLKPKVQIAMSRKGWIIAVDGYSSTGKSTVSKRLAARLGYTYIDTGAMYRMVTLQALADGVFRADGLDTERLKTTLAAMQLDFQYNPSAAGYESILNGKNVEGQIRHLEVSERVSEVAALPFVREALVKKQREMARDGGVVMDGRDVGSVVFPDADIKFFMTSPPRIRAERRYRELMAQGEPVTFEEIEENIRKRDRMDTQRAVGPLIQTPDAIVINNEGFTLDELEEQMYQRVIGHAGRD